MAVQMILGAGVSGLAAGLASGWPVYEQASCPGGICCSYYRTAGETRRLAAPPAHDQAYRFELGGGHWIFGGDPAVLQLLSSLCPLRTYQRCSSVLFPTERVYVPYPLQNHLRCLGPRMAAQALTEITKPAAAFRTMKEWLLASFGPTLCNRFFFPFHELYTVGLYDRIAPQDAYKSPVDLAQVIRGAFDETSPVGYNTRFVYPEGGLDALTRRLAERCEVRYEKQVKAIDVAGRSVHFSDGSSAPYKQLISTLPLNRMVDLAGLRLEAPADPHTSVLVLNIGARRGRSCPADHWLYLPATKSGFYRVGFYSNVDRSFLPASSRGSDDRVSIYVERAYPAGQKPSEAELAAYTRSVIDELTQWDFIGRAEVADPTWIEVAYTWSLPGSSWREQALRLLQGNGIFQVGRYGRWIFQGIADSIRDGLYVGAALAGD